MKRLPLLLVLLLPLAAGAQKHRGQPITVTISPKSVSLLEGATEQFSATVSGTANTTVLWTVSTGGGSVTTAGLYTAPDTTGTFTVTATSQANTAVSASATVTVTSSTSTTIFYDDFQTDTAVSSAWTVVNRQGDWSNDELECYTPANVTVGGSGLVETAKVQNYTCGDTTNTPYVHNYTSGAVGWATFNFTYGTVEYEAEFAGGIGTWPAVWMLGYTCQASWPGNGNAPDCNWPAAGANEIDITEIKGADFTQPWQNVIDPAGNWITCQPTVSDVTKNFHVYQFTWSSSALTWYIDGVQTCKVTNSAYIPSTPMFLIINVAVGGNGGGTPNNSTFPQSTTVQYVKVTQP